MKNKAGFTLVELSVALAIGVTLTAIQLDQQDFNNESKVAQEYGHEVSEYNSAVATFLKDNADDPDAILGTYAGSSWLKATDCSGTATKGFLNCTDIPNGRTIRYATEPTTVIAKTAGDGLQARTVWTPIPGEDGGVASGLMGLAAISATGSTLKESGSETQAYSGPTYFCPDITAFSPNISMACGSDKNRLVSISSSSPKLQKWLLVDHGNVMESAIEFDDGSMTPTKETGAGATLDDIDSNYLRMIVNISRLYNVGGTGNDSIILGQMDGETLYSDSYLTSAGLLEDAVISDGAMAVLNDFQLKKDAILNGNLAVQKDTALSGTLDADGKITGYSGLEITGDIDASRDISAGRDINVNDEVYAAEDILTDNDLLAKNDINSRNNIISNNNIQADNDIYSGHNMYATDNVIAGGDMGAKAWYDTTKTGGMVYYNVGGYVMNPAGDSRFENVDVEGRLDVTGDIYMAKTYTKGSSCSTSGLLGTEADGSSMSCVGGVWTAHGVDSALQCEMVYVSTPSKWTPSDIAEDNNKYCPAGYQKVGFDTGGHDGMGVSGGALGDVRAWAFCCKVNT